MKKILALALACLMLVALLAGCASSKTDAPEHTSEHTSAEAPKRTSAPAKIGP